ncbi:hypothetical protein IWZ00DRAFT_535703 [Phyllosticta capitalensis]|uniref:Gag1-like clamp domain-containing protein n=1 Tax=Phyllosticta capitalensis TaxID=121624 RepID=A0ABR1Z512_9PEZI
MESHNQAATREARRFLADRVRNDWSFPDTPPTAWEDDNSSDDDELRGVHEFRERYYGSTDDDTPRRNSSHRKTEASKFRFEHPDAVADEMADRALRRKRRRRRRLLAEMQWNEGLATFIAQRDAWTGATAARKHLRRKASDVAAAAAPPLPVAPRLLAHNPIRDSITPRSYPDIYSKIVLQSQTPKVPINLRDMTTALVQGWKADGEWPPKPGPADPLPGARNGGKSGRIHVPGQNPNHHHQFLSHHPHVKRGVDSVRKVFRLSGSGGGHHDHGASPAA